MRSFFALLMIMIMVSGASAADLKKAEAEGKVNFYANITAIEPIMDDFNSSHKIEGIYTRISTSKYLATVLTEFSAGKLQADVLQGPLPIIQMLKDKGVTAPYQSPSAAGRVPWPHGGAHDAVAGECP